MSSSSCSAWPGCRITSLRQVQTHTNCLLLARSKYLALSGVSRPPTKRAFQENKWRCLPALRLRSTQREKVGNHVPVDRRHCFMGHSPFAACLARFQERSSPQPWRWVHEGLSSALQYHCRDHLCACSLFDAFPTRSNSISGPCSMEIFDAGGAGAFWPAFIHGGDANGSSLLCRFSTIDRGRKTRESGHHGFVSFRAASSVYVQPFDPLAFSCD